MNRNTLPRRSAGEKIKGLLIRGLDRIYGKVAPDSHADNSDILINLVNIPGQAGKQKIFCVSMQRNGTTSVGNFLADHGFRVAGWHDARKYEWSRKWYIGDHESIFKSIAFRSFQAFEDDPWWMPDFYRVLHNRFPGAKFILFYRDSDQWFDSMKRLFNGKISANPYWHCKIYGRLSEYYRMLKKDAELASNGNGLDRLLHLDETLREHYKKIYQEYNNEVIEYFKIMGQDNLFVSCLEDKSKWIELGKFLGVTVNPSYNTHANNSKAAD